MLDVIGNLTTLRNDQDLLALALRGWSGLGHGYISFKGAGVAIARTDSPFTASDVLIPIPGNT